MKHCKGVVLVEAILVIVPYLVLTLGLTEYLWYFQVKLCLTRAAEAAVHVAAVDHGGVTASGGSSVHSLSTFAPDATTAAQQSLISMGYSNSFATSALVQLGYIQDFATSKSRYANGGVPQNMGRRLAGAQVSIPMKEALIFGNFAVNMLRLSVTTPPSFAVTAFMWKQWKPEAP